MICFARPLIEAPGVLLVAVEETLKSSMLLNPTQIPMLTIELNINVVLDILST